MARSSSFLAFGLGFLLALAPACKSSKGEVCRCAEDCQDGLVCLVGSSTVLEPGECGPSTEIGHCVDDESLSQLEGGIGDLPIFDDIPSKRDLGAGESSESESTSESTSTESTSESSTDSTGTDSSGTDSTDSTGTDSTSGDSSSSDSSGSDSTSSDSSST